MIKTTTQQKDLFNRRIDISRPQSSPLELYNTPNYCTNKDIISTVNGLLKNGS